jgi:hypothetical protein
MDGAFCRQADIAGQAAQEELSDFTSAPMGFAALEADDEAFDLHGELVSVAHWPAGAVAESVKAVLLIAIEDFVACFAGNSELAA